MGLGFVSGSDSRAKGRCGSDRDRAKPRLGQIDVASGWLGSDRR
jgi:hypothetical protein